EAGDVLWSEGKVHLVEGSKPEGGRAKVDFFRRHHDVMAERIPGGVVHDCTCAHFENRGTGCAHLWALLLALEHLATKREAALLPPPLPLVPSFLIDTPQNAVQLSVLEETASGPQALILDGETIDRIAEAGLRATVLGIASIAGGRDGFGGLAEPRGPWALRGAEGAALLSRLVATGLVRTQSRHGLKHVQAEPGAALDFVIAFAPTERTGEVELQGRLVDADGRSVLISAVDALIEGSDALVLKGECLHNLRHFGAKEWPGTLLRGRGFQLAAAEWTSFVDKLARSGPLPRLQPPGASAALELLAIAPIPRMTLRSTARSLEGRVTFLYGNAEVEPESAARLVTDTAGPAQYLRNAQAEAQFLHEADGIPGLNAETGIAGRFDASTAMFDSSARMLLQRGWRLRLDGRPVRRVVSSQLKLSTKNGRLSLGGEVRCDDGAVVSLLGALKAANERRFLDLNNEGLLLVDGALAERLGGIAALVSDPTRVSRAQALLLQPLLESDAESAPKLEGSLARLVTPQAVSAPEELKATLRPYQCDGLAWLCALSREEVGGILADDMGLGKTVQVLALLLELRARTRNEGRVWHPALVVAPASLLWNWESELERFAPTLRVLRHHGSARELEVFDNADVVLTTYGTLQRDVEQLTERELSVLVLDEAQVVRNPQTRGAVAVRALKAPLKIALTGTPVENSARDLWALLDAVNPGILGEERRFMAAMNGGVSATFTASLARAVRPFVLRRTKEAVLPELPALTQQVIHAEAEPAQEKLCNTLLAAARRDVLGALETTGRADAFTVLEALLRLRQAACHPGLVDPTLRDEPSGKVEQLVSELEDVLAAGHRALVFSQFVTFLDLISVRLERENIVHARLDGRTKNREEVVRGFEQGDGAPVLLTSLKVGGTGLNLTAADYVFLMDPWWNPAVEAQAIGRAHRIGQNKPVFAYRMVTRGSIEERILELQQHKRDLAEALLGPDAGAAPSLEADDLRWLFAAP
ncbi:MAG: DEAD/DEAH box helicase, partial [Planctomycetes bacterium]|nr:DEAD/DEAH box helicase [Planctomycetota bacterium]